MRRNEATITIALGLALTAGAGAQTPLGTAFTYQGRLTDNGTPATGSYDLQFELFDASSAGNSVGGPVVLPSVVVSGGLFTVPLDFGPAAFAGSARWLETGVRPGGTGGPFTILVPRQELTPSPNARFSATAPWVGVTGKPPGFADDIDDDVLGGLGCAAGQIAKWNGTAWACAADGGTTGQDVVEAYGTAVLAVTAATTIYTLIPGLALNVTIPAGAKVHVSTNGGIQCTQAGNAYAVVDLAIFVDGAASSSAGQRRVVAANTAAVGQMIANWSFGRTYDLTAGAHDFDVRAIAVDPSAADANVSSGSAPQLQGVLTVTVIKQ